SWSSQTGKSMTLVAADMDVRAPFGGGLRRETGVLVVDGAEVPVGERVVVDVQREVRLSRDLEVRAVPVVADIDDRLVHAASPDPHERHLDAVGDPVCELFAGDDLKRAHRSASFHGATGRAAVSSLSPQMVSRRALARFRVIPWSDPWCGHPGAR